jgi:hypothetical protein
MVQASSRLREAVGKPVSLVDLFRFPTVAALAEHLGAEAGDDASAQEGQSRAQARKDAMAKRPRGRAR